jgi:hypothetical protein
MKKFVALALLISAQCAHAEWHPASVTVDNVHSFYGDAQSGSDHLCKSGFVPLTMAV